jgi:hypothetical protein
MAALESFEDHPRVILRGEQTSTLTFKCMARAGVAAQVISAGAVGICLFPRHCATENHRQERTLRT